MGFVLSDEQEMLRETALSFFRDELPISRLRELRERRAGGHDPDDRAKIVELGLFGILIPEDGASDGFGMIGMGQVLEAQGRTLAATPLLQSALIATSAVLLAGTEEQKAHWLSKIADGSTTFAFAIDETAHHAPGDIKTRADRTAAGYRLRGRKRFVPDANFADVLIVAAGSQDSGLNLFLVPTNQSGVAVQEIAMADSHGVAHVGFNDCNVPVGARLGRPGCGGQILDTLLDRARIGVAAEMLGMAQAAFDITLEYLRTRSQFGQLIGEFQALQHRAAKMFIELELTRSCVMAALAAVDAEADDIARLASLAKARAGETLHLVTNECVQLHGGIGMTDEHDAGLYMKRARVLEALYGSASFHRDRYARLKGF